MLAFRLALPRWGVCGSTTCGRRLTVQTASAQMPPPPPTHIPPPPATCPLLLLLVTGSLFTRPLPPSTRARSAAPPAPAPGLDEAAVRHRIEAAVAAALAAAKADADDDAMTDLLVCLGHEERKVQALSEALAALGGDVEAVLEAVQPEEEGEGEGGEGEDLR